MNLEVIPPRSPESGSRFSGLDSGEACGPSRGAGEESGRSASLASMLCNYVYLSTLPAGFPPGDFQTEKAATPQKPSLWRLHAGQALSVLTHSTTLCPTQATTAGRRSRTVVSSFPLYAKDNSRQSSLLGAAFQGRGRVSKTEKELRKQIRKSLPQRTGIRLRAYVCQSDTRA